MSRSNSPKHAIALEQTTSKPAISHYTINVAPFDRAALANGLAEVGSPIITSPDEPDVPRFTDNDGSRWT